jgi:hypothetical protein
VILICGIFLSALMFMVEAETLDSVTHVRAFSLRMHMLHGCCCDFHACDFHCSLPECLTFLLNAMHCSNPAMHCWLPAAASKACAR